MGLDLQSESDKQTYLLIGDTATIKAGDRVKVAGKRKKKDASGAQHFLVERVGKDYGPCTVPATAAP